jgi:ribosome-associated protein
MTEFINEQNDEQRRNKLEKIRREHSSEQILSLILAGLCEKNAEDIFTVRVDEITTISDYMVIATGTSSRHARALSEIIKKLAKEEGFGLFNPSEAFDENWTILDFGTTILHIMSKTARSNYKLEELWGQGKTISCAEFIKKYPCDLSSLKEAKTENR